MTVPDDNKRILISRPRTLAHILKTAKEKSLIIEKQ